MKSLKVEGIAYISIPFSIEVSMSEEQFEKLSEREQNKTIFEHIDWNDHIDPDNVSLMDFSVDDAFYVDPETGNPIED